jgi:hypothetical protein
LVFASGLFLWPIKTYADSSHINTTPNAAWKTVN